MKKENVRQKRSVRKKKSREVKRKHTENEKDPKGKISRKLAIRINNELCAQ